MAISTPSAQGEWKGYAAAALATLIWSGNFVISRVLYDQVPPVKLALLRWTCAAICVLPLGLVPLWRSRAVLRGRLGFLALTAFTGVTLFNTMVYIASHTTQAVNLSLIATSTPVFTVFFARFLQNEALTWRKFLGVSASIAGVTLLVSGGSWHTLTHLTFAPGDLWMLVAGAVFAVYSVAVPKKPPELPPMAFITVTFWLGLLGLVPWAAWEGWDWSVIEFTPQIWGAVLYIGLGASLTSFILWNRSVRTIGPARAGFVYYSLPLFTGLQAAFWLGEPLTWVHFTSGALIIGGIVVASQS